MLNDLHFTVDDTRSRLAELGLTGPEAIGGQIPFTENAKGVLEAALREALSLGHNYIGTEHLLLGLVRRPLSPETPLAHLLDENGATAEKIRGEVWRLLQPPTRLTPEEQKEAAYDAAHEFELAQSAMQPGWYVETWTHDDVGTRHGPWETKPTPDIHGDVIVFFVSNDETQPTLWLTISNYASIALAHTEEEDDDD